MIKISKKYKLVKKVINIKSKENIKKNKQFVNAKM